MLVRQIEFKEIEDVYHWLFLELSTHKNITSQLFNSKLGRSYLAKHKIQANSSELDSKQHI
jgi:hypothetical protein